MFPARWPPDSCPRRLIAELSKASMQIQVKRGPLANRPVLAAGELYYATDTAQVYVGPTPTLVGPVSGSGGGGQGTALLDFGSFPGVSDASLVVTGQAGILAASVVQAWILPANTVDHSADEHLAETLDIFAGNIVPGVGFTIYGFNEGQLTDSTGKGTRIYGKWNVAWKWS
jgi:hypothetical protein